MSKIKEIIKKRLYPNTYSSEAYVQYLRKNKVLVGEGTHFFAPRGTTVDIRKPYLIKIGKHCAITQGVVILAHDYSRIVLRHAKDAEFFGGSLPVEIGDHVFIGINSMILMGTKIGDHCVVGAGAVVKGEFPAGSIIAGNPAKVIGTVDRYYEKCKANWVTDAKLCAKTIYDNAGRLPKIEEMSGYAWMFLPHTEESIQKYPWLTNLLADDPGQVKESFFKTEPIYPSFEAFLQDCQLQ